MNLGPRNGDWIAVRPATLKVETSVASGQHDENPANCCMRAGCAKNAPIPTICRGHRPIVTPTSHSDTACTAATSSDYQCVSPAA